MQLRFKTYQSVLFSVAVSLGSSWAWALPDGFDLRVLSDDVPNARQMVESASGNIYVGTRRVGDVYAVVPNDAKTDAEVYVIASDLPMPSGLTIVNGDLIIGALNQVWRIRDIDDVYADEPSLELITDDLPDRTHHGWKYLDHDSEGFLYLNVGAPCNICLSDDERFASILRMNLMTGATTIYARGVRNSVGFAWHPITGKMWFSDNGGDWMGPEVPLEEINVVTTPGEHFGYPFIHAGVVKDPTFGADKDPDDYTKPVFYIRAHAAALGIAFYTGDHFPADYENALFVAEHGSWNHAPGAPRGYRVSVIRETQNGLRYDAFADQWLVDGKVEGRPNDVLVLRDGSLLISDDQNGTVYRVTYSGNTD
ncbi:MAG: PQQ-dependent sugar dehydrogenase [Gammaproteobacteria bacterium]|nr:PQQ-dependent sugar dehydrogenase [Gammaproteobacteria bacterium]